MSERPGESLLLTELPTIERIIAFVRVRNHLTSTEGEDFASYVKLKLLEDDEAILRQFQGRSSLRTYLTIVIQRLFLDYRTSAWGKWRPSAQAKRLGTLALLIERLLVRDGYTCDEAYEMLTTNHGLPLDRAEMDAVVAKLPARVHRTFESDDSLGQLPSAEPTPERALERREGAASAAHLVGCLQRALAGLEPLEHLMLTMRYHDGRTVAEIAATLKLDQKALYRRFDRIQQDLEKRLESDGFDAKSVKTILESGMGADADARWEGAPSQPSIVSGVKE